MKCVGMAPDNQDDLTSWLLLVHVHTHHCISNFDLNQVSLLNHFIPFYYSTQTVNLAKLQEAALSSEHTACEPFSFVHASGIYGAFEGLFVHRRNRIATVHCGRYHLFCRKISELYLSYFNYYLLLFLFLFFFKLPTLLTFCIYTNIC